VGLEEPAVEKGNPAEALRGTTAPVCRLVQRSEEERTKEVALDVAPAGQCPVVRT